MRAVPGKPGWFFEEGTGVFRSVSRGKGEERSSELVEVIDWCPKVLRYVVGRDSAGNVIRTRYTVQVGAQTHTFSQEDLREGRAWDNFHHATGYGDRQVAGALADIVRLQGREMAPTIDVPLWNGDQLVFPPADLLPDGYEMTGRAVPVELVDIASRNPKLALQLGFAYAAPYVSPLRRQPFIVHLSGTAAMGKTTGHWAAASFYGRPDIDGPLTPSWNATTNVIYARLGKLAVLPAFYDDLHAANFTTTQLRSLLFGITQGGSRGRADRTGEERRSRHWAGVVFSTGNKSILGMLGTAPEVSRRVVEIPAPIVSDAESADRVQELAQEVYGTWSPVPIAAMQEAVAWAERMLRPILAHAVDGVALGIMRCVALGVAGAWCVGGKDLAGPALDAARELLADQVMETREAGGSIGDKFLEAARQIVIASAGHFPTREEWKNYPSDRPKPIIHGFHESPDLYILTNYVGTIATLAGLDDATVALRELKTAGRLRTDRGRLAKKVRAGDSSPRVYHLVLSEDGPVDITLYGDNATGDTGDTGDSAGQRLYAGAGTGGDTGDSAGQRVNGVSPLPGVTPGTGAAPMAATRENATVPGVPAQRGRGDASPVSPVQRGQRTAVVEQAEHLRRALAKVELVPDGATEADFETAAKVFGVALDGLAFAGPPARVGQLLFEKLTAQYGAVPVVGTPPTQPVKADQVVTMFNLLDRSAEPSAHRFVVGLDVNAQFLAAAGSAELGTGEPVEGVELALPGYVQLGEEVTVGPGCVLRPGTWLANPMANYLASVVGDLPVTAGYHWPSHRRWLSLWASRVRRARADLLGRPDMPSQIALRALKLTYASFLGGWMNSGPERGNWNHTDTLRPDWMHHVHSLARANMLRALGKAKPGPFATLADAAYFLVDDPMQPKGLTLSEQPGKWKAVRIGHAAEQAAITVAGRLKVTTLAAEIEAGRLGNVAKVVNALHEQRANGGSRGGQ